MRYAFALLGLMGLIVWIGFYFTFSENTTTLQENEFNEHETMSLTLTSPVFEDGGNIPSKYTCDGENINPELHIDGVPDGARSLVLVMDDPDIPRAVKDSMGIEKFDHWVLYDIPADTDVIEEDNKIGTLGLNSRGSEESIGPCPPDKEHRYIYRLYALSDSLNFAETPTLDEVELAAKDISLDTATLTGLYNKIENQ